MSDELIELEEEEHTSQLTSPVVKRILGLLRPHWKWVVGFMITIMVTSILDAYFTYLNKQIVDVAIALYDKQALMHIATDLRHTSDPAGRRLSSRSFTWPACSVSGSNMTCASCCSTTCRTCRFPITRRTQLGA